MKTKRLSNDELFEIQAEKLGLHMLLCSHSMNRKQRKYYYMYCDILREKNGKVDVVVYGHRNLMLQEKMEKKTRYGIDKGRVISRDFIITKPKEQARGSICTS